MKSDRIACAAGELGSKIDRPWAGFAPFASRMSLLISDRFLMTSALARDCEPARRPFGPVAQDENITQR